MVASAGNSFLADMMKKTFKYPENETSNEEADNIISAAIGEDEEAKKAWAFTKKKLASIEAMCVGMYHVAQSHGGTIQNLERQIASDAAFATVIEGFARKKKQEIAHVRAEPFASPNEETADVKYDEKMRQVDVVQDKLAAVYRVSSSYYNKNNPTSRVKEVVTFSPFEPAVFDFSKDNARKKASYKKYGRTTEENARPAYNDITHDDYMAIRGRNGEWLAVKVGSSTAHQGCPYCNFVCTKENHGALRHITKQHNIDYKLIDGHPATGKAYNLLCDSVKVWKKTHTNKELTAGVANDYELWVRDGKPVIANSTNLKLVNMPNCAF